MANYQVLTNPITDTIKQVIAACTEDLSIAVPFINGFARTILNKNSVHKIKRKRLITRVDNISISSFDIPTLEYLFHLGVKLYRNDNIHLKLYIFDNTAFNSSSNLTKGGFENNIELTSRISESQVANCKGVFEDIINHPDTTLLTLDDIKKEYPRYHLLKKQDSNKPNTKDKTYQENRISPDVKIKELIHHLFYEYENESEYKRIYSDLQESNRDREEIKRRIKKDFHTEIFYTHKNHALRGQTLHYKLFYGKEGSIAGPGLRENQFKEVFTHKDFQNLITFIYPPTIGEKEWNLKDDDTFLTYCNGIFDFNIPQYKETMPIRLASYFYPEYFLPIFKLSELEEICKILGLETTNSSKGVRLYNYNKFLLNQMKAIPRENHIKSNIAYQLYFAVMILKAKDSGVSFEELLEQNKQTWRKNFLKEGREILSDIGKRK